MRRRQPPAPRLRDLCRSLAEAGASLVVNCHEHCPQGIEWHCGIPIIYCPGNLWFPPRDAAVANQRPVLWNYGYLAKVSFDDKGPFALELLPYKAEPDNVNPLEGALREDFLAYIRRLSEPLGDDSRLQAFFDAWCTESGKNYLNGAVAVLNSEMQQGECGARRFLEMRNLFTCESHHDLVRGFLRLAAEGRLDTAARLLPEIKALQNPAFAL